MASITEVVQDLAAMAKRGAITEDELKRLLGYLTQSAPTGEPGSGDVKPAMDVDLSTPSNSNPLAKHRTRHQRRYLGRGSYGWVTSQRAQALDLVALMELGGAASRAQVLDHIVRKWGPRLTTDDRDKLPSNGEERWRKTCQWGFHYLQREGLIERPRRGLQSLTAEGKIEATARGKDLPV